MTKFISAQFFTSLWVKVTRVTSGYSLPHVNVTRSRPAIAVGHGGLDFSKIESSWKAVYKNKVKQAPNGKSPVRERKRSQILAGTLGMQIGFLMI